MDNTDRRFYVYMWFFKATGIVFYIGKGSGKRYLERKSQRNPYFRNIVSKYSEDVDVRKHIENLTEDEAYALEKKLIGEYWAKGECKANFHEGRKRWKHPEIHVIMIVQRSEENLVILQKLEQVRKIQCGVILIQLKQD
jgi:hypothetical protein